jgi:hypothetical protein
MPVLIHLRSPKVVNGKLCEYVYGEEDFPTTDSDFYEVGYTKRVLIPKADIELIEKNVIFPKDDSNVLVVR